MDDSFLLLFIHRDDPPPGENCMQVVGEELELGPLIGPFALDYYMLACLLSSKQVLKTSTTVSVDDASALGDAPLFSSCKFQDDLGGKIEVGSWISSQ